MDKMNPEHRADTREGGKPKTQRDSGGRTCLDHKPQPGTEAACEGNQTSGGRPRPWCRSGTASGHAGRPWRSDSATASSGGVGAEDSAEGGECGLRPPCGPARLLSSSRLRRDAIWANLIGYHGDAALQSLRFALRKAQPIRGCGRFRGGGSRVGGGQELRGRGGGAWASETRGLPQS